MRQKSVHPESSSERIVKTIRRATRKRRSSEEKIQIVLDGLRGESSIAELCRREGIAEGLYYAWSKEFVDWPSKRRRSRWATSDHSCCCRADRRRSLGSLLEVTGHVGCFSPP
jgi:transposase